MINFFLSLKTSVWLLFALVCLFFIGSALMPAHREVFTSMNDDILLRWTEEVASTNVQYTWWLFASVVVLALLTVNTLVCSLQAIRGKWISSDFLLRISPQIMHIGFLLILVAHLVSACWGYKLSGVMPEGGFARLPENKALSLGHIDVQTDSRGFTTSWSAEATLYEKNEPVARGMLGPNAPLFHDGVGVYLKSLQFEQGPAALLVIAEDPGALWAFAGGLFFLLGSIVLLVLKWKKA
jgi:hypothetical protein